MLTVQTIGEGPTEAGGDVVQHVQETVPEVGLKYGLFNNLGCAFP